MASSINILDDAHLSPKRIESFSDGVFAVVITLLVLRIKIPDINENTISQELPSLLFNLIPNFISYIVCFIMISGFWISHHQLFSVITRSDRVLIALNSLFLMILAFIPFPVGLIGNYPFDKVAVMFFGVSFFLAGVSFLMMKWYVLKKKLFILPGIDERGINISFLKNIIGPLLFLSGVCLAFIDPRISLVAYILAPSLFQVSIYLEKVLYKSKQRSA